LGLILFKRPGDPDEIWYGQPDGTFVKGDQELNGNGCRDVALADFNGDGWLDAYVGNGAEEYWFWPKLDDVFDLILFNDQTGRLVDTGQRPLVNGTSRSILTGDLDHDGDLDLVVGRGPDIYSAVLLNDGKGVFSVHQFISADNWLLYPFLPGIPDGRDAGTVSGGGMADLNNDGFSDLVLGTQIRSIWLNDGTGTFSDTGQYFKAASFGREPALADFDGDGDRDVYLGRAGFPDLDFFADGCRPSDKDGLYINDGKANLTKVQEYFEWPSWYALSADFNNDGWPDVLLGAGLYAEPVGDPLFRATGIPGQKGAPNVLLLNDGQGRLFDSGLRYGEKRTYGLSVGVLPCSLAPDAENPCTFELDEIDVYTVKQPTPPKPDNKPSIPHPLSKAHRVTYSPSYKLEVEKGQLFDTNAPIPVPDPKKIICETFWAPSVLFEKDERQDPPKGRGFPPEEAPFDEMFKIDDLGGDVDVRTTGNV